MVVIQTRPRRKASGGLYRSTLSKRTHMLGRQPSLTKVGTQLRKRRIATKGGGGKQRLFEANVANVFNPKTKRHEKAQIKAVVASPANTNFVRRNIITKGSVIDTEKGKARVTSRPGQSGTVDAVLVE
jgi:small subunit ribosomal protein S8e